MTDTCPVCGATRTEIETDGHRLQRGGVCSEACTCIPECFSMAEHRAEIEADAGRACFSPAEHRAKTTDALTADRCPRCRQVLDDEHTELSCAVEVVVHYLGEHDQEKLAAAVAIATDQTSDEDRAEQILAARQWWAARDQEAS